MTNPRYLLAGDVGGTKTHLGLFDADSLVLLEMKTFASADFSDLPAMLQAFFGGRTLRCQAVGIGAAGPVLNGVCRITNLPWTIQATELSQLLNCPAFVINDLEANGNGIAQLSPQDFFWLQKGSPRRGNAALIAAGTGLGECLLFWDGTRHIAVPSEGGHASFAPGDPTEADLLIYLWQTHDHVSWERLVSGTFGFANLYNFFRDTGRAVGCSELEAFAATHGYGAAIAKFADEGSPIAISVMKRFVALYGAEAGNLALKTLATTGLFVGGGIAPKILKWMTQGFLKAFVAKGRFQSFLEQLPVAVILNDRTALLGAAAYAKHHAHLA
ncbi:MAG: glucokinase [Acidobacteriota bacterium]